MLDIGLFNFTKMNLSKVILPVAAILCSVNMSAKFVTPGNGMEYTMKSLALIPESGVRSVEGNATYLLSDTIEFSQNDRFALLGGETVTLSQGAAIFINGNADLAPDSRVSFQTESSLVVPGHFTVCTTAVIGKIENIDFNSMPVSYFPAKPVTVRSCSWNKCMEDALCFRSPTDGIIVDGCSFTNLAKSAVRNPSGRGPSGNIVITNNEITIRNCILRGIGQKQKNSLPAFDITSGGKWKVTITDNVIDGSKFPTGGIRVINFMTHEGKNEVEIARNEVSNCVYGIFVAKDVEAKIYDNIVGDNRYGDMKMNAPGFAGFGICIGDNRALGVSGRNGAWISGNTVTGHLWGITTNGKKCVANAGNISVDKNSSEYNPGKNIIYGNGCVETPDGWMYYPGKPVGFFNDTPNTIMAQYNQWGNKSMTPQQVADVIMDKNKNDILGEVLFTPYWDYDAGIENMENDKDSIAVEWYTLQGIRLDRIPSRGIFIERYSNGKSRIRMIR